MDLREEKMSADLLIYIVPINLEQGMMKTYYIYISSLDMVSWQKQ